MDFKYEKAYLCEKKSQVIALANALDLDIDSKNSGLAFSKDKKNVVVQLQGHVLIGLEPQEYDPKLGDFSEESIYVFPEVFKMKPNPSVERIFLIAKKYLLESDQIFIATDSDCEGAAIAMNVIRAIGVEDRVMGMIPMGSTHEIELRKAINDYKSIPYKNLAESGIARHNLDWSEGMTYSRAGGYYLGNKYQVKLPFGGVMTPTVALVVSRELENNNHIKRYFWTVSGYLIKDNSKFECSLERKFINDKDKEAYTKEFETEKQALDSINLFINKDIKIATLSRKESTSTPPQLYELGQLQIDMYNSIKASLSDTMDIGQYLYDAPVSINTYVRTDSVFLKEAEFVDVNPILNLLKNNNIILPKIIDNILSKKLIKRVGKKGVFYDEGVVAHGAIVPVLNNELPKWLKDLSSPQKYYYMLVAKRYVANFMEDYKYNNVKGISEEINDCRLVFSENTPISAGWKLLYEKTIEDDILNYKTNIPNNLKSGDFVKLESNSITKKETKPRPYFTLATLLSAMIKVANLFPDNKDIKTFLGEGGIGTNATREKIIKKLLDVDPKSNDSWLYIDNKEKVRPTEKAISYINILPEELTSPIKRALLSKELKLVETGKKTRETLLSEYKLIIAENVAIFKKIYEEKGPIAALASITVVGKCPICSKDVIDNRQWYTCTGADYDSVAKINNGCDFKIYKLALAKLGKKEISIKEVTKILKGDKVTFNLRSEKGVDFSPNIIATKNGIEFSFEKSEVSTVDLGACPVCGAGVYEKEKIYLCSGADIYKDESGKFQNKGCNYKLIKASLVKFGKDKVTPEEVTELLKNKEIMIKGLTGSKGKFDCKAIIDNTWGLKLDFSQSNSRSSSATSLGKCPACKDGDITEKIPLFSCTNSKSEKMEDGTYQHSGCDYKIFKGSLSRFGKAKITASDIEKLLKKGSFTASLTKPKNEEKYSAKIIVDLKYGVRIDNNK